MTLGLHFLSAQAAGSGSTPAGEMGCLCKSPWAGVYPGLPLLPTLPALLASVLNFDTSAASTPNSTPPRCSLWAEARASGRPGTEAREAPSAWLRAHALQLVPASGSCL